MNIKTVTVLGANGAMGRNVSAIFASFGSAKVYMVCRNLDKAKKAAKQAFLSIRSESIRDRLVPVTYDELEKCISESDLVFESLSEDLEIKSQMYKKIQPFLKDDVIVATGTSGLSIKKLSEVFEKHSKRFFGIHMFNPPYNLTLCELVVHSDDQKELSKNIKNYLSEHLKRTVVEVKDKPSFLGNRIGFFFINEAIKLANENKDQGGIDYIDSIIGGFTGRNMAPLVTADFVGLDVTKSIIDYIYENTKDQYKESFKAQDYFNELISGGSLGKKVNRGFYYKDRDRNILFVYDIKQKLYRLVNSYQFYFSNEMIKNLKIGNYSKAISILINDESHEAIICKVMLLKYAIYSLKISLDVSDDITACDDAMATGFSWIPPIALIDLVGGKKVFRKLTYDYLDNQYIKLLDSLYDKIPCCSKYDYRPYLKAKY